MSSQDEASGRALPRVFVSFCSRSDEDRGFAQALILRLDRHPLAAWQFAHPATQIPTGAPIEAHCMAQVRASDLFVAVVSQTSFSSRFTALELGCALDERAAKRLTLVPVVDRSLPGAALAAAGDPWARLGLLKMRHATFGEPRDVEACVRDVCDQLGVSYRPLRPPPHKLPLRTRVAGELARATPRQPEYLDGYRQELLDLAEIVEQAYHDHRLRDALGAVEVLLHRQRQLFPSDPAYYPQVVRGAVLLELGQLPAAFEVFSDLAGREDADENAWAGLGKAQLLLDNPHEARAAFERGLELAAGRDLDLIHDALLASLCAERTPGPAELKRLDDVDDDPGHALRPEERTRLAALQLVARAAAGEARSVVHGILGDDGPAWFPADLLQTLVDVVEPRVDSGRDGSRQLTALLTRYLEAHRADDVSDVQDALQQRLAHRLFAERRFDEALPWLHERASRHPRSVVAQVELARGLDALGRRDECRQVCADVLAHDWFSEADPPGDEGAHHYFVGMAHWLLGERREADYRFTISRWPRESRYAVVCREGRRWR